MDWGILQGLGQGLQTIGKMKMEEDEETRRQKLAEKLQDDRLNKEEARRNARPDPARTTYEEGEGGVTWKVIRNSSGTELERVLASKTDIDRIKKDTEKENLTIESLRSQIDANKTTTEAKRKDMTWAEEDYGLLSPEEKHRAARIKAGLDVSAGQQLTSDTSIQNALTRSDGKDSEDEPTLTEYAKSYIENNPAITAEFVESKKLTATQVLASVQRVLQEFAKRGVKPTPEQVRHAIQLEAEREARKRKAAGSGGIKTSLLGK